MSRIDGRNFNELRNVRFETDFVKFPEGSVLVTCGNTKVLCCASVEDRAPKHVPEGTGWVTAEYSMLPRANRERSRRDVSKLKLSPRSAEIQRLIGRSLRAAVDLTMLPDLSITIDCDVLQGDGGIIALSLACDKLVRDGALLRSPIKNYVAAVSAGIVDDQPMLDLCYEEDSSAMVDLNCVMNDAGELIEIQGTGEGRAFTLAEQQELVALCQKGIKELIAKQKAVLEGLK